MAVVEERLKLPKLTEQIERLVASESANTRDKITSTLAGVLEKDNTVIIKHAAESVESSPGSALYLKKVSSETSANTGSPDCSPLLKSDFFSSSKNFTLFAIDSSGQMKELKEELSHTQNLWAAKNHLEASWQRERELWARERAGWLNIQQSLQELADVFKQDKVEYKQEKENLTEKWESCHAEAKA
ncbi:hypothetical protein BDN71DRAFT_1432894 [Pleurotus eryngii]|uniref:Uncharacterized protein n=1 Tax=Pleurotus eryngii TaxID=5323 RepID=A0A9P6D6G2_PLEER|nr:hypothetical protein BDN71DRAFT_1432894 [Pleurotus eryngii]